jgi:Fe-S oxidoreductase
MFNPHSREEAIKERQTLMEGRWAPILHNCAACHACNEFCPQGANPWDLVSKFQGIFGEVNQANVWGERAQKVDAERPRVLSSPRPEPAPVVLATCTIGELNPQAFDSLLYKELPKLVGPAYYCCQALEFFGDEEGERARARGFVEAIARHQPQEVICYHDACYFLLTYRLKEYGLRAPFRPVHIFEYLLRTLEKHRDNIRPLRMKVAYQRPCTSRNTQEKESFLDRLLELIGCERVARRYDRENALCCGDVLAFRGFTEKALEAARTNIQDSLAHGADALVYLCPSCIKLYGKLGGERGLPVYQISELCQMAIGEKERK